MRKLISRLIAAAILFCGAPVANTQNLQGVSHSSKSFVDICAHKMKSVLISGRSRFVCDEAGIFSGSAIRNAAVRLAAVEAGPKHACGYRSDGRIKMVGYQFGVAAVEKLDRGEDIKTFTERVFNLWGVGNTPCNDGILLAFSLNDRKTYLKTGKGSRAVLTDSHAAAILESLKPHLRSQKYDDALMLAITRVIEEALKRGKPPPFYRIDRVLLGVPYAILSHPWESFAFCIIFVVIQSWYQSAFLPWLRPPEVEFLRKLRHLQEARTKFSGQCHLNICVCVHT